MVQPDVPGANSRAREYPLGDLPRHVLVHRVLGLLHAQGAVELRAGRGWGKSTLARAVAAQFAGEVISLECPDLVGGGLAAAVERMSSASAPVLLLADDADCLAGDESAAAALASLTSAPSGRVAVLLCTTGPVGSPRGDAAWDEESSSGLVVLTASDLRFSMGEVADLRARSAAASPLSATEAMRLTGGWPRGIQAVVQLDDRNPRRLDLLEDAIESSVLTDLSLDERQFLQRVSALDSLDLDTATALLGEGAQGLWDGIEQRSLPLVSFADGQLSFRRPLRSYLRSELARHEPGANERLRAAYVEHLLANGRVIEAIDWYLAQGSLQTAMRLITTHVAEVDITTLEPAYDGWAKALGEDVLFADNATAGLVILMLNHRRQTEQAAVMAQQLINDGRMDAVLEVTPSLRPVVIYVLHNRPNVALALLPGGRGNLPLSAVTYSVAVTGGTEPVEAPPRSEWGDLAIHVLWGLLWQGRLVEALQAVTEQGALVESNASVVLVALWSDQFELAEQAYQQMPKADGYPWGQFAHAALALYRGEHEKGLRLLSAAMPDAQRGQAAPTFETLASYLTFKAGDPDRAIKSLETRLPQHLSTGRYAIGEWGQLILALGYLSRDRPSEAAGVLEAAIASMEVAERSMLLASARIAYAEARARLGADPTEVGRILDSATVMQANIGSSYWNREVLDQAHDLRRLGVISAGPYLPGAEGSAWPVGPDGKPVSLRSAPAAATAVVTVGEPRGRLSVFEQPLVLEIDGVRHSLGRTKLAELIADLAVHGGVVNRVALQMRMFPDVGQRSAGNHFRQVLFKLRELTGIVLDRPSRTEIGWPAAGELTSTDLDFETRLRDLLAADQVDAAALRAALDGMSGHYVAASELSWVLERRQLLNVLFEEGVARLLRHPECSEDLEVVRSYGDRAVALSPYSEDIYQLMIEAELSSGSSARARAIYRRAVYAMKDLGLEPSGEIRMLARKIEHRLKAEAAAANSPADR